MDMHTENGTELILDAQTPSVDWRRRAVRILIAFLIILIGAFVAIILVVTKPKTTKRPPEKWVPLVSVTECRLSSTQVEVKAMGTVIPARSVILKARVSGQVTKVHPEFTDGGFVEKDDL